MSEDPDVSVIIAAFNAERQIARALDSALAQVGIGLEVVVADDASRDATVAVAQAYADRGVRVVRLERNGGPSTARNAAIAQARGRWLAVLDADDAMAPGRLASLVEAAEAGGADLIADNMTVRSDSGSRLFIAETLDGGTERLELDDYARHNCLFGRGRGYGYLKPLFRRGFLSEHGLAYDARLRIGEDFMLVAEMLARGAVYLRRRSADYLYSVHDQSISHRLSAAQAQAMADGDRRFLDANAERLTPAAARAMRQHLRSLEDGGAYIQVLEALKARRVAAAAVVGLRRPLSLRHLHMPLGVRWKRAFGGRESLSG